MKEQDRPANPNAVKPRASLLGSLRSIGWAFLGIRSSKTHHHETARISPLLLIAVAFAVVLVLVFGLMALVHWLAAGVGSSPAS